MQWLAIVCFAIVGVPSPQMKCPGCASEMVQVEVQTIEIDRCPSCGGIVLDKGETEAVEALGLAQVIEGGVSARPAGGDARATAARCAGRGTSSTTGVTAASGCSSTAAS